MRDGDDLEDAGHALEHGPVDGAAVAGDADRGALRARDRVGLEAARLDRAHDARDLLLCGALPHHDEHRISSGAFAPTCKNPHAIMPAFR